MKARLVVFPIKARNWCFTRSIQLPSFESSQSSPRIPSTLKDLWNTIYSSPPRNKFTPSNAELLIDFASNKMNTAWTALEKAPTGSVKNKIHGLGLRLLSRVKPSENFLKSISKEVTSVEIMYPSRTSVQYNLWIPVRKDVRVFVRDQLLFSRISVDRDPEYSRISKSIKSECCSKIMPVLVHFGDVLSLFLNARLVRRRLRHIALRGTVMHKKYFYGSVSLLPITSVFMVLPLPNIPFFWILFRTYSHWRALQGSKKLLQLVSDSENHKASDAVVDGTRTAEVNTGEENHSSLHPTWVLQPSKELEELLNHGHVDDGLSKCSISDICNSFNLNTTDVLKYQNLY